MNQCTEMLTSVDLLIHGPCFVYTQDFNYDRPMGRYVGRRVQVSARTDLRIQKRGGVPPYPRRSEERRRHNPQGRGKGRQYSRRRDLRRSGDQDRRLFRRDVSAHVERFDLCIEVPGHRGRDLA